MNVSNFVPPPQLWQEEIAFAQQTVAALPAGSTIVEIGTTQGGGLHLMAAAKVSILRAMFRLPSFDRLSWLFRAVWRSLVLISTRLPCGGCKEESVLSKH